MPVVLPGKQADGLADMADLLPTGLAILAFAAGFTMVTTYPLVRR